MARAAQKPAQKAAQFAKPVTVTLPPGARVKRANGVQSGATMAPEVISVMPGSGRSLVGSGGSRVLPPAIPVPTLADLLSPVAPVSAPVANVQYDPMASLSRMMSDPANAVPTSTYDPATSPFAPVPEPQTPMLTRASSVRGIADVYQPNYTSAPTRPAIANLPPPPVRDTGGEKKQRANAARIAGLVPLLSLLFGGSGANVTTALGRTPGLIAQAGRGADVGAKTAFEQAMDAYQLQGASVQGQNQNLLGAWQAEVQATQNANAQETQRARLSRDDRDAALTEEKNRQAAQNTRNANVLKAGSYLASLASNEARTAAIGSGILDTFGITDPESLSGVQKMFPSLILTEEDRIRFGQQQQTIDTNRTNSKSAIGNNAQRTKNDTDMTGAKIRDMAADNARAGQMVGVAQGQLGETVRWHKETARIAEAKANETGSDGLPKDPQKALAYYDKAIRDAYEKQSAAYSRWSDMQVYAMPGDTYYASGKKAFDMSLQSNDTFIQAMTAKRDALAARVGGAKKPTTQTSDAGYPAERMLRGAAPATVSTVGRYANKPAPLPPAKALPGITNPTRAPTPATKKVAAPARPAPQVKTKLKPVSQMTKQEKLAELAKIGAGG